MNSLNKTGGTLILNSATSLEVLNSFQQKMPENAKLRAQKTEDGYLLYWSTKKDWGIKNCLTHRRIDVRRQTTRDAMEWYAGKLNTTAPQYREGSELLSQQLGGFITMELERQKQEPPQAITSPAPPPHEQHQQPNSEPLPKVPTIKPALMTASSTPKGDVDNAVTELLELVQDLPPKDKLLILANCWDPSQTHQSIKEFSEKVGVKSGDLVEKWGDRAVGGQFIKQLRAGIAHTLPWSLQLTHTEKMRRLELMQYVGMPSDHERREKAIATWALREAESIDALRGA